MRPRLPLRRILFLKSFRPPNSLRTFTQNTLLASGRPQLPFLFPRHRRPAARFLTTETKQWIKDEMWKAGKYTTVLWTTTFLLFVSAFGIQQEWIERQFPTPAEWTWNTRRDARTVKWEESFEEVDKNVHIDWAKGGEAYRRLLKRLEDPNTDGAGLREQDEGGILVAGVGKTGLDISMKSEPWRRGYYEILMGAAMAAEHLDGWVRDTTRNIAFPGNVVTGPSNPNPRPVPPGAASAPKEEDCEPAFEGPETYYIRILTTQGFTEKQRVDAALAYGAWLDFKKTPQAAAEMYRWALDIATSGSGDRPIVNPATGIINPDAGLPSANVLAATTALALHHTANNDLATALPIFLSILRARRSLPMESPSTQAPPVEVQATKLKAVWNMARSIFVHSPHPPAPEDGTSPPVRTPKETCEEAGIMTYVGEILYASKSNKSSREDGLAWTREAVDIAEEQLRRKDIHQDGKKTCKQCLSVGLGNWEVMVRQLSELEKEAQKLGKAGGWLGLGRDDQRAVVGRWESEEQVVKDRIRRSRVILEAEKPITGIASTWLNV